MSDNKGQFKLDGSVATKLPTSALGGTTLKDGTVKLTLRCLVPLDFERVALVVKRQLEGIGVEMDLQEVSADEAFKALGSKSFEAVLLDVVGGPSFFRAYEWWHSRGSLNPGTLGNAEMDAVLDRARHATSDAEYKREILNFERYVADNPPAIFLAWGERARAVSDRFLVSAEAGRDVLTTLRLWKPSINQRLASRN